MRRLYRKTVRPIQVRGNIATQCIINNATHNLPVLDCSIQMVRSPTTLSCRYENKQIRVLFLNFQKANSIFETKYSRNVVMNSVSETPAA